MPPSFHRLTPAGLGAVLLVWLVGNLSWLRHDLLLRDGDEEGHVGAAELLRLHLDGGHWLRFVSDAWRGDLGEYPPLYPAIVAAGWWLVGGGQPGDPSVRGINLLGHLLAGVCVALLARHLSRPPHRDLSTMLGLGLTLCLPLATGLSRHYMPEGLLVGAVALSVLLASLAADRKSPALAGALGISLGLGLLIKQTFLPLAVFPVLVAGWRMGRLWWVAALPAALVCGPWLLGHLNEQAGYVGSSVQSGHTASTAAHLLYYPALFPHLLAGPVLALAGLAGGIVLARRDRRALWTGLAWAIGIVLFMAIPKKYPRLVAAISPSLVLLAAVGLPRLPRGPLISVGVLCLSAGWVVRGSLVAPDSPSWLPVVDEKCPQHWLRPPSPDALGLPELAAEVRSSSAHTLRILDPPELPCSLQTTHPWHQHVEPYLRREALEVQLSDSDQAELTISFHAPAAALPGDTALPTLGLVMRMSRRPGAW